ncbi:2-phospho-L-lactate guanylyltransferase [Paraconexibacter antarcticus]|uniref:Phosphoenolpyruvate guanylyltransferase n=1 Tax=Paraconexibacter antarcticus TaxID=2949664 RepID=A0ABY5DVJ6_9ACTN|nr:2-phospho-L-lactate guanylyltransferase [Paraconexibacter antarcticus]UTI66020.1 2-phospho-L-lactate guanylyltransferase [Paraconexibacter antarcticus]
MTTFAVLPVKHFVAGKTRLADDLGKGTRKALVEAMVTDVLIALRRSERIDHTLVVTGEAAMEAIAHGYDAQTVLDPDDAGHSQAAIIGIEEAITRGARRVMLVPGDCPALHPKELDTLLTRAPAPTPEVVIIPDRHGTGTNGLVLTPPDIIAPSFGPGSCERHVEAAKAAGARVRIEELPSLVLDVDTIEDLAALREALGGGHGNAAHTRGMLNRLARR